MGLYELLFQLEMAAWKELGRHNFHQHMNKKLKKKTL